MIPHDKLMACTLCGRFCRSGILAGQTPGEMDNLYSGGLAGTEIESGQDQGGESDEVRQSGFVTVHGFNKRYFISPLQGYQCGWEPDPGRCPGL